MDVPNVLHEKYYADFAPTKSAQAIHKAGSQLFCCEDLMVKGKLGNGYFASVFLVLHHPTNQLMAMKLTNEASVQRREMEFLSSLNHENVIKFHGSCVIGARFACLTEFANGGSLASLLSAKGVDLPWSVRAELALDIAKGVHYLHSQSVIHRDLSSANILIRVTPGPLWDNKESSFPFQNGQLPYGLRVGHNILVSDAHFQHEYLNDPKYRRPGHSRLSSSNTRSMQGSSSTSPCSSSCKISPMSTVPVDQTGEYIDHQFSNSSIADWDLQNGDSNPLLKETRESLFRSLPTVVPIWHQTTWVATSRPRYTAIVADLGLCLDLSQENVDTVSLVGNPYYISPECLNRIAPYSFAADLFAVGLLICELITHLVNDGVNVPRTKEFGLDHQQLPVPASCPNWLFQIAVDCCTVEHRKRPTAAEVIERLTVLLSAHSTAATTTDLAGVLGPNYSIDHTAHSVNPALLLNGSSELSSVTKGQVHSVDA